MHDQVSCLPLAVLFLQLMEVLTAVITEFLMTLYGVCVVPPCQSIAGSPVDGAISRGSSSSCVFGTLYCSAFFSPSLLM